MVIHWTHTTTGVVIVGVTGTNGDQCKCGGYDAVTKLSPTVKAPEHNCDTKCAGETTGTTTCGGTHHIGIYMVNLVKYANTHS